MKYYMSNSNTNLNQMNNRDTQSDMSDNSNTQNSNNMINTNEQSVMDEETMHNSEMKDNGSVDFESSVMSKQNMRQNSPNPPWPSMQPVVVMPPGSNATSIGLPNANIYKNRLSVDTGENRTLDDFHNAYTNRMNNNMSQNSATRNNNYGNYGMGEYEDMEIMDMNNSAMSGMNFSGSGMDMKNVHGMMTGNNTMNYRISDMVRIRPPYMEDMTMTEYLMGRIGEYIKVDLCCGGVGNSKVGVLREIGDDFIVLEDSESGNYMVCSLKGIQLIQVYDDGDGE